MIDWAVEAEKIHVGVVELRRVIHREPELGLDNSKTLLKIKRALKDLPLELKESTSCSGLIARLDTGRDGRHLLLRGDMDALPLTEETGLAFSSAIAGAMHACGHDAHTAMLVGAARLLCQSRDTLRGVVDFMFQPGEEGFHGAKHMLTDGSISPLPDAAFALHVMPNALLGVISGRVGPVLASYDNFFITISGRGGHASMPHNTLDPIPVACELVLAIQSLVTRKVRIFDPAVVTVGKVSAGTTFNVIPETAHIEGTFRTLSNQTRALLKHELPKLAASIAEGHGCKVNIEIDEGYPVTVANGEMVELGRLTVEKLFGKDAWQTMAHPIMAAEDFSYVLEEVPGAYFFLGVSNDGEDWETCCPLHSSGMLLNEDAMIRGVAFHAALAHDFLNGV